MYKDLTKITDFLNGVKHAEVMFYQISDLHNTEKNDCMVKSFAIAFNVSYEDAHEFLKIHFSREFRKGTYHSLRDIRLVDNCFGKRIIELGQIDPFREKLGKRMIIIDRGLKPVQYTVIRFLRDFPKGTYLIFTSGHAFVIKDSVVYGSYQDATKLRVRIENAFKIVDLWEE